MKTYELAFIISSQLNSQEADEVKNQVEKIIQDKGGTVLMSERSEAKTLAYPIKKQISGYFTTLELRIEEDKIKEIKDILEKETRMLRYAMLIKGPVKHRKEKRAKKPLLREMPIEYSTVPAPIEQKPKDSQPVKPEKIDEADLDKKLEEILSE